MIVRLLLAALLCLSGLSPLMAGGGVAGGGQVEVTATLITADQEQAQPVAILVREACTGRLVVIPAALLLDESL